MLGRLYCKGTWLIWVNAVVQNDPQILFNSCFHASQPNLCCMGLFFCRSKIFHLLLLNLLMFLPSVSPASGVFRSLWRAYQSLPKLGVSTCLLTVCSIIPGWESLQSIDSTIDARVGLALQSVSWSMKSGIMILVLLCIWYVDVYYQTILV